MTPAFLRRAYKFFHLMSSRSFRDGLTHRVAAAVEHEGAMRALKLGSLVDVGANVGQFSLLARTVHPTLLIHAIEPLPAMADRFERLFAHDQNVHLHRIAAGEETGTAELHVSGHPDSSSLLPITDLQNRIFSGTAEASVLTVNVDRLDNVLKAAELIEPIMIKLDVQGFELAALKGMPDLLRRASYVYSEVSFKELYEKQPLAHEVIAWLAERHFLISGVYNPVEATDGSAVQADILFAKSSH